MLVEVAQLLSLLTPYATDRCPMLGCLGRLTVMGRLCGPAPSVRQRCASMSVVSSAVSHPHWSVRLALSWVALTAFIDTFAIVPLLAPYAISALGASAFEAGAILGLYSLASLLGNLGSGVLLDRLGRRWPMILSLLVAGAIVALYTAARTPGQMMLLRMLHGLAGAIYVPALFVLVSERASRNRTRAIGVTSALIGLTALVGPVVSGVVASRYGVMPVFWGVAAMMLLAGVGALRVREVYERPSRELRIHPQAVWRLPAVRSALWLTLAMTFAMGVLTFSLPVVLEAAGYDPAYRGRMFGLFALIAVALMIGVRNGLALGGASARAVMGVVLFTLGALSLNWLPVPQGTWLAVVLYGVAFGLSFPAVHLVAYEQTPGHLRGTALAGVQGFYSLGYVLGPLAAGYAPLWAGTIAAGVALAMLALSALALSAGVAVSGSLTQQ